MKTGMPMMRALLVLALWLGGMLAAQAQTRTVHSYYTDPQGTVLAKTDAQGNIIARYDYTPYGSSVASLGSPPNGPGYTGHVNDPETGLVYMQARYYQPIGRFLSPDPVGPSAGNIFSFNRYDYANNNPIANIDPNGKESAEVSYSSTKSLTEAITQHPQDARMGLIMMGVVYGGAAVVAVGPEAAVAGVARTYRAWKFEHALNRVRDHLINHRQ